MKMFQEGLSVVLFALEDCADVILHAFKMYFHYPVKIKLQNIHRF